MSTTANPLPSTLDDIFKLCPRFRILVIGKTGVGKSSLINRAFNIDSVNISSGTRGNCDINTELSSDTNPLFVLHDSNGFEAGDTKNFEVVKKFIHERQNKSELADRLHAIWFCIETPYAGNRLLEDGDEAFLKLALKDLKNVPVVTVFTKYDQLVGYYERTIDAELDNNAEYTKLAEEQAEEPLRTLRTTVEDKINRRGKYLHVSTATRYSGTLSHLLDVTRDLVRKHVEGDVWILLALAQRSSAQVNISASIDVRMKRYWPELLSSTFPRMTLWDGFDRIHSDIVKVWNFRDPEEILTGKEFRGKVLRLIEESGQDGSEGNGSFSEGLSTIQTVIDMATPLAVSLGPVAASIGLTATFLNWVTRSYRKVIPSGLRCLMAYITDLTVLLDKILLITLSRRTIGALTQSDVNEAFDEFYSSNERREIHKKIRDFVQKVHVGNVLKAENAHNVVIQLIEDYCPRGKK